MAIKIEKDANFLRQISQLQHSMRNRVQEAHALCSESLKEIKTDLNRLAEYVNLYIYWYWMNSVIIQHPDSFQYAIQEQTQVLKIALERTTKARISSDESILNVSSVYHK